MLGGFIKPTHLADFLRQRSALVSGHIMDDWRAWLRSQGAKGYNTHDLEIQWLRGQGYTGTFADMFYAKFGDRDGARAFFKDGGEWTPFAKTTFLNATTDRGSLRKVELSGLSTQAGTPTPDEPVPIVSTTGNVTVRSYNKNLAYTNRTVGTPYTINGVTYVVNADGSVTANGTATLNSIFQLDLMGVRNIRIVAGTAYAISGLPSAGSSTTLYAELEVVNDDGTVNYYGTFTQAGSIHTPAKSGWARFYVTVRNGYVANNLVFKPQLEVSSVATAFEKNTTSTQTLPLGTTQLRSLPNDVSDRIYKDGSTWKLEQNVKETIYNGSEPWTIDPASTTVNRFLVSASGAVGGKNSNFSSHFVHAFSYVLDTEHTYNPTNYLYVAVNKTRAADLPAWKAWLATNNLTVVYQVTPITTEITDPTLITALENIRTYQGVTNITAPTPFSGEYLS